MSKLDFERFSSLAILAYIILAPSFSLYVTGKIIRLGTDNSTAIEITDSGRVLVNQIEALNDIFIGNSSSQISIGATVTTLLAKITQLQVE